MFPEGALCKNGAGEGFAQASKIGLGLEWPWEAWQKQEIKKLLQVDLDLHATQLQAAPNGQRFALQLCVIPSQMSTLATLYICLIKSPLSYFRHQQLVKPVEIILGAKHLIRPRQSAQAKVWQAG